MSIKAERGTKRVCQSCGGKFYDLNRDPIVCPLCQSVYQVSGGARYNPAGNHSDSEDEAVLDAGRGGLEFVPLDEVAAREGDELPDIDSADLGDVGEDAEVLDGDGEEEAFLETEDEGEADVSGFVGGGGKEEEI
jgi:uncharacterized protein (TIGR02300 family)